MIFDILGFVRHLPECRISVAHMPALVDIAACMDV